MALNGHAVDHRTPPLEQDAMHGESSLDTNSGCGMPFLDFSRSALFRGLYHPSTTSTSSARDIGDSTFTDAKRRRPVKLVFPRACDAVTDSVDWSVGDVAQNNGDDVDVLISGHRLCQFGRHCF